MVASRNSPHRFFFPPMKNWLTPIIGFCAASLLTLASCEKDETQVVMTAPTGNTTLKASATDVQMDKDNTSTPALTLSWNALDYGYAASPTYIIQFDKKDSAFVHPITVEVPAQTSKTFTSAELNDVLLRRGMIPNIANSFDVRVLSGLRGTGVDVSKPLLAQQPSAKLTLTATPYGMSVLYVPGSYQGWSPGSALTIGAADASKPKEYEGYIYLDDAAPLFKFTTAPDWAHTSYGVGDAPGKLSTAANAGNLAITTGKGYYRLTADLGAMTWTATKTEWGIIGDATPRGWDASTPLTYDAASKTWKATMALTAGKFKFRANDAWTLNYGADTAPGALKFNTGDIAGPGPGTYEVVLDLSKPGSYNYKLNKK
jgi:hypothetical protein